MSEEEIDVQDVVIASMPGNRIETGAVRFIYDQQDKDWPGLFIRGDNCIELMLAIKRLIPFCESKPASSFEHVHAISVLSMYADVIEEDVLCKPPGKSIPEPNES